MFQMLCNVMTILSSDILELVGSTFVLCASSLCEKGGTCKSLCKNLHINLSVIRFGSRDSQSVTYDDTINNVLLMLVNGQTLDKSQSI